MGSSFIVFSVEIVEDLLFSVSSAQELEGKTKNTSLGAGKLAKSYCGPTNLTPSLSAFRRKWIDGELCAGE